MSFIDTTEWFKRLAAKIRQVVNKRRVAINKFNKLSVSPKRQRIIDLLKEMGPLTPKEIAESLNEKYINIRRLLGRMFRDGQVQKDINKYKHCEEWLNSHRDEKLFNIKPKLINITNKQFVIYAILISLSILIFDFICGFSIYTLKDHLTVLHIFLGIMISSAIYNKHKFATIIIYSIAILFILRNILTYNLMPNQINYAIINTIYEVIIVFGSTIISGFLLRYTEPLVNFAEITNINVGFEDPLTKKKYDMGTCSNCGMVVKIAEEKFIKLLGKSEKYFCDNCGSFIRGNPLMNICMGLGEVLFGLFLIDSYGSFQNQSGSQSSSHIILLLCSIGLIYDGIKRLILSIIGIYVSVLK